MNMSTSDSLKERIKSFIASTSRRNYGALAIVIIFSFYRYWLRMKRSLAIKHQSQAGRVVILGAGFSGICMAIKLKKAGMDSFTILEKSNLVGGTWNYNAYPGAACDVPSILYCFSFEPMHFFKQFSSQPEIRSYLQKLVQKYDLERHIKLNCEVTAASYIEEKGKWIITAQHKGTEIKEVADIFISAQGQLNTPKRPNIPGQNEFQGTSFHTARWNKECSLDGKNVAIIGTGATATQIIPVIAPRPKHFYVFQRTPSYLITDNNQPLSKWKKILYMIPLMKRFHRWGQYWKMELTWPLFKSGTFNKMIQPLFSKVLKEQMDKAGLNSDLQKKFTPKYEIGCKRILINHMGFYEAFARPNVSLVAKRIKKIDQSGIVYDGGRIDLDVIIYATGFESNKFVFPVQIDGKGGHTLNEIWGKAPWAYNGISIPECPNMFLLYGPNTNLGHNSIIFMIECQVNYIMQCINALLEKPGKFTLEVREDVAAKYRKKTDTSLDGTIWNGCESWYKTADGKIVNNLPTGTFTYWRQLRKLNIKDYYLRSVFS